MVKKSRGPAERGLWAYAYDVVLPDNDDRVRKIQALLDREHSEARDGARTWAGRVVVEPPVTRILVVADSPEQRLDVNRRIEAELKRMNATFEVTVPLAVVDEAASPPVDRRPPK